MSFYINLTVHADMTIHVCVLFELITAGIQKSGGVVFDYFPWLFDFLSME